MIFKNEQISQTPKKNKKLVTNGSEEEQFQHNSSAFTTIDENGEDFSNSVIASTVNSKPSAIIPTRKSTKTQDCICNK